MSVQQPETPSLETYRDFSVLLWSYFEPRLCFMADGFALLINNRGTRAEEGVMAEAVQQPENTEARYRDRQQSLEDKDDPSCVGEAGEEPGPGMAYKDGQSVCCD